MTEKSESREHVRKVLKEEISRISGVKSTEIDENLTWEDYYFDSMKIANLADAVCNRLNIEIELVELFNAGSIKNAALYLSEILKKSP